MKSNKGLMVKMPKSLRAHLSSKFNLMNAKKIKEDRHFKYIISGECPLCTKYFFRNCDGCIFKRFNEKNYVGCEVWIKKVLNVTVFNFKLGTSRVNWESKNDKKARQQITLLRERAEKLIEWV